MDLLRSSSAVCVLDERTILRGAQYQPERFASRTPLNVPHRQPVTAQAAHPRQQLARGYTAWAMSPEIPVHMLVPAQWVR